MKDKIKRRIQIQTEILSMSQSMFSRSMSMAKSMAPFGPSRCCAMMSSIVMSSLMSMAQLYGMVSFAGSRFTTTVSLLRAVSTCESQKEEERKSGRGTFQRHSRTGASHCKRSSFPSQEDRQQSDQTASPRSTTQATQATQASRARCACEFDLI